MAMDSKSSSLEKIQHCKSIFQLDEQSVNYEIYKKKAVNLQKTPENNGNCKSEEKN